MSDQIIELIASIVAVVTGGGATGAAVHTKRKNTALAERVAKLEAYNNANHSTIQEMKKDIKFVKEFLISKGNK